MTSGNVPSGVVRIQGNSVLGLKEVTRSIPYYDALYVPSAFDLEAVLIASGIESKDLIAQLEFESDCPCAVLALNTLDSGTARETDVLLSTAVTRLVTHYGVRSIIFIIDSIIKKKAALEIDFRDFATIGGAQVMIYNTDTSN